MGEIYNCFKKAKKQAEKKYYSEKTGLVEFEYDDIIYRVFYSRRRANRYSFIHCSGNIVEWEQFPMLPRISGRMYGIREPIFSVKCSKECVTLFVVMGKPGVITGLDEGIFRSVHRFDTRYVNVMSQARFKEL